MKKISSKVIKKFFNLIEDSREFYKEFLKKDEKAKFMSEVYLEIQEFLYSSEKYQEKIKKDWIGELNLTEYNYLYHIGKSGKINITQLSKKIKNSKGYTSKVIKKLTILKYIKTFQEESNKKEIYIELTNSGKLIYEDINRRIEKIEKSYYNFLLDNFSEEELKFLYNFFVRINRFQNEEIEKI